MRKLRSLAQVPQSAPLPGQVPNSAGGYAWTATDKLRLERFLILGTEAGSYYASPQALTLQSARAVQRCLDLDGVSTVRTIREISVGGRAARQAPALFALAMALKCGDLATRKAAAEAVPAVARTASALYTLAANLSEFGGWGRLTRQAVGSWFEADPKRLAYQAIKYGQREGWSARDLLRKAHPRPASADHDALFRWITQGELPETVPAALEQLVGFEACKAATSTTEVVALIKAHALPRECVPTQFLASAEVWMALLERMPMGAMVRNLGKLASVGVLTAGSPACKLVASRLRDPELVRRSRLHPLALLVALTVYRGGSGVRGKNRWRALPKVCSALEAAFQLAFGNVPVTGLRWRLAVDVSGSMGSPTIAGMPGISPALGAAAMTTVTVAVEPNAHVVAFSTKLRNVDLPVNASLQQVVNTFRGIPMGGTDCAAPILDAEKRGIPVDVFVVYTDSETWFGKVHPAKALARYRKTMGIDAKLIVVGMVANKFTIADPNDAGMLDVVGFDSAAPAVMAQFAAS